VFSTVYTSGAWANEPMPITHSEMAAIINFDFIYIFFNGYGGLKKVNGRNGSG
jgi:hypothetical protein